MPKSAGRQKNGKKINWKLITDLPVGSRTDAIEKLEWYALRWKIEVFHKILKSGCKAEESKLRTAQRLTNLISLFCILSWRVFWMTMLNRSAPDAPPTLALTVTEIDVLDRVVNHKPKARRKTLSCYLIKIARLGGYLARASDPPPGNTSCGAGCQASPTSRSAPWQEENLWVIESFTACLRSSVNRFRFIRPSFVWADSNSIWRNFLGAGQTRKTDSCSIAYSLVHGRPRRLPRVKHDQSSQSRYQVPPEAAGERNAHEKKTSIAYRH
jgi:hypothetical protein